MLVKERSVRIYDGFIKTVCCTKKNDRMFFDFKHLSDNTYRRGIGFEIQSGIKNLKRNPVINRLETHKEK